MKIEKQNIRQHKPYWHSEDVANTNYRSKLSLTSRRVVTVLAISLFSIPEIKVGKREKMGERKETGLLTSSPLYLSVRPELSCGPKKITEKAKRGNTRGINYPRNNVPRRSGHSFAQKVCRLLRTSFSSY